MTNLLKKNTWIYFIIFFGAILRLYLIINLPAWHDEIYSVWASTQSILNIASGISDPVHLPGYYLFIKLWSVVSDHFIWLRLSSLIGFVINSFLIYKLIHINSDQKFGLVCLFCYVFSGYFIIFDWQLRMYTLSLTLILASFYLWQKIHTWDKAALLFVVINNIGLWFDYTFYWYFIPFFIYTIFSKIKKPTAFNKSHMIALLASLVSCGGLVFYIFINFNAGSSGIFWMKNYAHPSFSIPYYLGAHQNILIGLLYFYMSILGFYLIINSKTEIFRKIFYFAFSSLLFTVIVSSVWRIIFHIRSLQILGICIVIAIAHSIIRIYKLNKYASYTILFIIFINNLFIFSTMYSRGSYYIVDYFPWKNIIQTIPKNVTNVLLIPDEKLPSPVFLWGLEYSLKGKETLGSKKFAYKVITKNQLPSMRCKELYNIYIGIYTCSN